MRQADAMMAIFFPWTNDFFESGDGLMLKNHLIVDQLERAKHLPDRRTSTSNKCMPKQFWNEWDRIRKEAEVFPEDWDKAIRPILAHRQFSFLSRSANTDGIMPMEASIQSAKKVSSVSLISLAPPRLSLRGNRTGHLTSISTIA